jgi:hypothetical protein
VAADVTFQTINQLQTNWVWVPDWVDSSESNTAGRIIKFTREFNLPSQPNQARLHCSADTRYKLYVNGVRVGFGPARSSPLSVWYYDTLDMAPHLKEGHNELVFVVVRYFAALRSAMPFARTSFPGLTVVGTVDAGDCIVDLSSRSGWQAQVDDTILFPMGLADDVFLHVQCNWPSNCLTKIAWLTLRLDQRASYPSQSEHGS